MKVNECTAHAVVGNRPERIILAAIITLFLEVQTVTQTCEPFQD